MPCMGDQNRNRYESLATEKKDRNLIPNFLVSILLSTLNGLWFTFGLIYIWHYSGSKPYKER